MALRSRLRTACRRRQPTTTPSSTASALRLRPSRPASPSAPWRWQSPTPRTASSSAGRSVPIRRSHTAVPRCCSRPRTPARLSTAPPGLQTPSPSRCRLPPRWRRPMPPMSAGAFPTPRSRCTAASASPGSTICTSSSSAARPTRRCSATPSGTASGSPTRCSRPAPSRSRSEGDCMGALERISVAAIGTTVADLEAETKRAEAAGIECVWAPELFRSSVTQAAYLAGRTETIDVATGIAWAFTRSPFILAVSALDIDEMSSGRFRLGLGSGVKRLNETWHNAEYGKPAPHMREAIEATQLIMQQAGKGEPIRYEGSYYDIDIKGWIRPHPAARESVPIYTAGVQGGMCRMAGDVADGLIGHPIQSLRWIDEVVVSSFEEGLGRSGRDRKDFDYLPTVCCAIDEDEGRAIEMARRTIAFYATVKTYMPLWEMHGYA